MKLQSKQSREITTALILAAGFGSRLRPITENIPKAMVEVASIPMIDRIIAMVHDAGIENIIVNTHYLADILTSHLSKYKNVKISHELDKILGTGGGILNVFRNICDQTQLLYINCDCLFICDNNPLSPLLQAWEKQLDAQIMLLLQEKIKTQKAKGDFNLSPDNKLIRSNTSMDYIYTGCGIISEAFFNNYKDINFFPLTDNLFKHGQSTQHHYYGLENHCQWFDIGTHEDLKAAETWMQK